MRARNRQPTALYLRFRFSEMRATPFEKGPYLGGDEGGGGGGGGGLYDGAFSRKLAACSFLLNGALKLRD